MIIILFCPSLNFCAYVILLLSCFLIVHKEFWMGFYLGYVLDSFYLFIHLFIYFYCRSSTVCPFSCHHFHHPTHLPPPIVNPTHLWLCPWVLCTCSMVSLPLLSPVTPLCPPLWFLSVCSLFQCVFSCFFFMHSFTGGHLDCLQHLAIVNCAAMNIGVHSFF